mgnify:CR=1 FL=1
MRLTTIILITFLALSTCCFGQNCTPSRDVEITDDGIIVTYQFHGGFHQEDPLHPGAKSWKIPGFGMNDVASEPAFPFHWDTFAIPDNVEVSVEVIDSVFSDTLFTLAPAYPPLLMSDTIGYTPERAPAIAPYNGFFPRNTTIKSDIYYYRGQGLIKVATMPVQYNCATQTVRSFSMIKYMVSFTSDGRQVKGRDYSSATSASKISISDHFLENTTLNYYYSNNSRKNIAAKSSRLSDNYAVPDNRDYLIVYPSKYQTACKKLEDWKRKKGFRTHMLCSDSLSVTDIKRHIMQLYNSSLVNLYYVIFIGGHSDIPSYANANSFNPYHLSDYYYGCVEEEISPDETKNLLPSVRRGRLLVSTLEEANSVVDKIITYESNPPDNPTFYNKALHCAYFQDEEPNDGKEDLRFVLTSEEIKASVEANGKTVDRVYFAYSSDSPQLWNRKMVGGDSIIPLDLQRPQFAWSGNKSDIINSINEGRFYILYSGHGISSTTWFLPEFSSSDTIYLNNMNLQPVLFSLACKSGKFISPGCLSECFFKKSNGGAIAVISPSEDSYIYHNDAMVEGMFNAVWTNPGTYYYNSVNSTHNQTLFSLPINEIGSILDFGTYYLSAFCSPSQYATLSPQTLYMKEAYHLFGDPSMIFNTQTPELIEASISYNENTIRIKTNDGPARFSFYSCAPNDYMIDSFVGDSIDYYIGYDSVYVCIDRPNCLPYIFKIIQDEYIQNENISDVRSYIGDKIKVGRKVTRYRPEGNVIIEGANLKLIGNKVELHSGTTIVNSNVEIIPKR